jgi:hypothetical protein
MPKNENIRRINNSRKRGLKVVEPKANELQIDLDGARSLHTYCRQYFMLSQHGLTRKWKERITPSKSGGSRVHVTITLPKRIDNLRRVAFQAILGSDIKREAFNLCRVIKRNKYPIIFFEVEHGPKPISTRKVKAAFRRPLH